MAYESAKIGGDDYTTYPLDSEGKPIPVDMVENGKSFKFVQPAVAKERFVKQFAKNNNMTVQEVRETVFGDQPVGKKKFYIIASSDAYSGIFGSYNRALLEKGGYDFNGNSVEGVEEIFEKSDSSVYLIAEKLNGLKLEDGSICEYIGPKVICLKEREYPTEEYCVESYDGKDIVLIDTYTNSTDAYNKIEELRNTKFNKRVYLETYIYDLENLKSEIESLSEVKTYSEAVEIIRRY